MAKKEERPHILAALKRVEKAVRADTTKDGLVQFRIEQNDLDKLYELAEVERKPLGTMIREWVLNKLAEKTQVAQDIDVVMILNSLKSLDAKLDDLRMAQGSMQHQKIFEASAPRCVSPVSVPKITVWLNGVPVFVPPPAKQEEAQLKLDR